MDYTEGGDDFNTNLNLTTEDLMGHNMTLEDYVHLTKEQVPKVITEGKILDDERTTIDNKDFHKLVYSGKQGIFDLKFLQYITIDNNKAYILTLSTEEENFDKFQEHGEKVMKSFKLK